MDRIRQFAFGYFVLFVAVVISGLMPQLQDDQGRQFGLFTLDLYDHCLHLASGVWALIAGLIGANAARSYFKLFGPLYFLDGVLGLITGSGYLDLGIFLYGPIDMPLLTKFFANLPHYIIGGGAIWAGYFYKPWAATA